MRGCVSVNSTVTLFDPPAEPGAVDTVRPPAKTLSHLPPCARWSRVRIVDHLRDGARLRHRPIRPPMLQFTLFQIPVPRLDPQAHRTDKHRKSDGSDDGNGAAFGSEKSACESLSPRRTVRFIDCVNCLAHPRFPKPKACRCSEPLHSLGEMQQGFPVGRYIPPAACRRFGQSA